MINDRYFYGSRIYRYKVMVGKDVIYSCVSMADDQGSVMRQIEAICDMKRTHCKVYCNGELKAEFGAIFKRDGKVKISQRRIKCRESGEIYPNLTKMAEITGWDKKYCCYLVNRTTRYEYLD